jgi:hypothetical protein
VLQTKRPPPLLRQAAVEDVLQTKRPPPLLRQAALGLVTRDQRNKAGTNGLGPLEAGTMGLLGDSRPWQARKGQGYFYCSLSEKTVEWSSHEVTCQPCVAVTR